MDWPRLLWTIGLVIVVIAVFGLLRLGWKHRTQRQSHLPAPPTAPALPDDAISEALDGVYVATTTAGHWQDRIVAYGMGRRARATIRAYADGVHIERIGEDPIWIPRAALTAIGTAPGIAGKVMGIDDGILVLTWKWGETLVDSGFRSEDRDRQDEWIEATAGLVAVPEEDA